MLELSDSAKGWREVGMLPSARYGLRAATLGENSLARRTVWHCHRRCSRSWPSLSLLLFNKTQIKGDILYVTGGDDGSAQDMDEVRTSWGHSDHTKRTWPTWQCQYFEHLFPKPSSRCWLGTGLLRRGHLPDTWQHQGELFVGTIIYSNLRDTLKTIEGLKSLWEMFCFNKQAKNCWKGGSAGSQLNQ